MSIDNLPAQLPREATDLFGSRVFPYVPDLVRLWYSNLTTTDNYSMHFTLKNQAVANTIVVLNKLIYAKLFILIIMHHVRTHPNLTNTNLNVAVEARMHVWSFMTMQYRLPNVIFEI